MRVEQLVSFVVSKGDHGIVLAIDFCYVLRHVYVFSPRVPPGFTYIASPATRCVTSGCPSKYGVDDVLWL